jgi:hypothetical protein
VINENEIVAQAHAVKYHYIEYCENFVVITQNRTRRRVYKGYYFEDTGVHIYVSTSCSGMFQHKFKVRNFIVNTFTKEWREFNQTLIIKHKPEKRTPVENNEIHGLVK